MVRGSVCPSIRRTGVSQKPEFKEIQVNSNKFKKIHENSRKFVTSHNYWLRDGLVSWRFTIRHPLTVRCKGCLLDPPEPPSRTPLYTHMYTQTHKKHPNTHAHTHTHTHTRTHTHTHTLVHNAFFFCISEFKPKSYLTSINAPAQCLRLLAGCLPCFQFHLS